MQGLLLVLVQGSVEVSRHGTVVATIDEPGSIFGERSAVSWPYWAPSPSATIRSTAASALRSSTTSTKLKS